MNPFVISAAQSGSIKGDIKVNMQTHSEFIHAAAEYDADVIVFPELSLTGYEPALARDLALEAGEDILNPLVDLAKKTGMTIIAGCPIRSDSSKPYIGAFIFQPNGQISIYRKRYLHSGEDRYFSPSVDNVVYRCKAESVGMAICADIENPAHPADAKKAGATIYAACVLMTPKGIDEDAAKHKMVAIMANHATDTGGYTTAGRSAIWNESGMFLAGAEGAGNALIIASKTNGHWNGRTVII